MTSDAPPGWAFNPSGWSQRLPLVFWSLGGFGIAGYLALFQLNLIPAVWDPVFGDGSRAVLKSEVSTFLPVPDAALGAVGYLFDAVTGAVGGRHRWRTMPWMVLLFGLAAGPLGLAGLVLVIMQPVWCGAWCLLCLVSAAISIGMISPSLDEALASLQHLRREKGRGRSWWSAFWGGGAASDEEPGAAPLERPRFCLRQAAVLGIGVWLMAAPQALDYAGPGRINDWIVGPLVASTAAMALWEFMRPLRWVNAAFGVWLAAFAAVVHGPDVGRLNSVVCGVLIAFLSARGGPYRPRLFGGGWPALWRRG